MQPPLHSTYSTIDRAAGRTDGLAATDVNSLLAQLQLALGLGYTR